MALQAPAARAHRRLKLEATPSLALCVSAPSASSVGRTAVGPAVGRERRALDAGGTSVRSAPDAAGGTLRRSGSCYLLRPGGRAAQRVPPVEMALEPPSSAHPFETPARRESRIRWVAATTLACVMAGHILLETARDALFLANVSVERLPFATIAIALLALLASLGPAGRANRAVLIALQAIAAVGTLGFWLLVASGQTWGYYALYVWSGVITSVVVVRFWLVLGEVFTITQGKRIFASIAMGGSVGALLGSLVAAGLAPRMGGEGLLLVGAGFFGLSAIGPAALVPSASSAAAPPVEPMPTQTTVARLAESVRTLLGDRYARRIAVTVVAGGITLTLGDYLFKSVVAEEVAPAEIATLLARIYLGLNVLSIFMLAIGVTPLVSRLGVDRSLAVLPVLTGLAALGVLGGGALAAIIALKAADGTLRYSLHKTASELLYLPMSSRMRESVKAAIDIVGQAAAKGLASALILGLVMLPDARMVVAGAVVVSAAFWVHTALRIRGSYLDVFRQTLRDGTIETEIDHPELDLASATSLVSALSDPDERRVIASMNTLVERGHVALIPSLILYHPAAEVVVHALDLFSRTGRDGLLPLLRHLIDHPDGNVRAAAVRATWALTSDVAALRALRDSECAAVRVSAVSGLHAVGEARDDEYLAVLASAIDYETSEPRLAAALAAQLFYHASSREALLRMASDADPVVAIEAVHAIRRSGDDWFTPHLVGLLGDRRIRDEVRAALIDRGEAALKVLSERLHDPTTDDAILRHIPRTIARFESPRAAEILMESFSSLRSGTARYKVLRGLESLRGGPGRAMHVDPEMAAVMDERRLGAEYDRVLEQTTARWRLEVALAGAQADDPSRATLGGELLAELLRDKRELAVGRLFKLLGLMRPSEDFGVIEAGLVSDDRNERASAQELLESLLPRDRSRPLLALVRASVTGPSPGAAGSAAPRAASVPPLGPASSTSSASASAAATPATSSSASSSADPAAGVSAVPVDGAATGGLARAYADILQGICDSGSRTLQAVALYHAGELGLVTDSRGRALGAARTSGAGDERAASLQDHALGLLRDLSARSARRTRPVLTALLAR